MFVIGLLKLKIDGIQYEWHLDNQDQSIARLRKVADQLEQAKDKREVEIIKQELVLTSSEVRGIIKSRTTLVDHEEIKKLLR